MTNEKKPKQDKKLSLHPLEFEEVLKGLLETEPPPKEQKDKPAGRSRHKKASKQAKK